RRRLGGARVLLRLVGDAVHGEDRNRGEDAEDRDHDEELDEGETLLEQALVLLPDVLQQCIAPLMYLGHGCRPGVRAVRDPSRTGMAVVTPAPMSASPPPPHAKVTS